MTVTDSELHRLAGELAPSMGELRRQLHQHPELAFEEYETAGTIREVLDRAGIEHHAMAGTGVVGLITGRADVKGWPVTGLRADMDALPVEETTGLAHASVVPGAMHACGHDGNVAMVLGAGLMLSRMRDRFGGQVKLIFQPGEEQLTGARKMIDDGVLENPRVDRIFACHGWPDLPTGTLGVYDGHYMASAGKFTITLRGEGTHGAYPHRGPDTVLTASEMVVGLNAIVSREINALDHAVLSVCMVNGGDVFNVVPEEVVLSGTFRCLTPAVARQMKSAVERVAQGIAQVNRCRCKVEIRDLVPPLENTAEGVASVRRAAAQVLEPKAFEMLHAPCMGSEDFSLYLNQVGNGAFIRVGVTPEGCDPVPLHNSRFDFDDNALPNAMALLTGIVLEHHVFPWGDPEPASTE